MSNETERLALPASTASNGVRPERERVDKHGHHIAGVPDMFRIIAG